MTDYQTRPALILDFDGTIRQPGEGRYINTPEDVELMEGSRERIEEYKRNDFLVLGITNQGGRRSRIQNPGVDVVRHPTDP